LPRPASAHELCHSIRITTTRRAHALVLLGAVDEARAAAQAGLGLDPSFTIRRLRAGALSDNPTYLACRERIYQAMHMAGLPRDKCPSWVIRVGWARSSACRLHPPTPDVSPRRSETTRWARRRLAAACCIDLADLRLELTASCPKSRPSRAEAARRLNFPTRALQCSTIVTEGLCPVGRSYLLFRPRRTPDDKSNQATTGQTLVPCRKQLPK
jgi:hypothetical protein